MAPGILAILPPLAAGGGGGEIPHASPELQTLVWVFVIFFLLLGILWKFAWKPLLAAVEGREKRIADSLAKAEEVNRASAEIARRQQEAMEEAQRQAKAVLDESRLSAERYRKEQVEAAKKESEEFLDRAKREIALEEIRARDALRKEVVDLTLEAASRVLGQRVSSDDDRRLAEQVVGEVRARRVGAEGR
jgi:F-type H+-transporting ATPase subunit b